MRTRATAQRPGPVNATGMAIGLVLASLACALGAELGFMSLFSGEEYAGAHVRAASRTLPQDFVDGQWQGITAASDTWLAARGKLSPPRN